ncbi:DUF2938 domain-containing protein [Burkholderia pseudomallei]|uniref:DUF2938 domain-containing protein n=1 Tax=Burkholderia pseudomallei TaxID=28450 RepID=A0AA40JEB9_BURPE|nr:DUF2938 domain-containing protein [Burkholderia pseudomallei]KGW27700.1 hypothetical protein Y047_1842 [Burkholderia pseudomallei MSHR3016]KGX08589.1 hypothetical protein Y036_1929 [Burkholderia pseudomallei]OMY94191.1 hypothetical protein AQ855_20560 [Burkholderia pseudomallei]OMZ03916.1 hypothetical protein AQ854_21315 [Burkholderia pseudomallei]OMZ13771.1 hypothetical protein AQ856_14495 [Burkholderia pseudomallei]
MSDALAFAGCALAIGVGATAVMDAWALVRKRCFGVPPLDYALVGRWLGHLARARVRHAPIAASPRVPGERAVGWAAHYLIGVAFAALLLALRGVGWAGEPTLAPALAVGIGSVAAPLFVMQPAMGAGIAASRTPRPGAARFHSIVAHAVFGAGLYGAGCAANRLGVPALLGIG